MPRAVQDDPRYQRVRERLVRALTVLAAERPVESVSVSELTSLAGVSRSAFYAHAASPADLLAEHLVSRLGPHLDRLGTLLEEDPEHFVQAWRRVYVDVLTLIREERAIYTHVFGEQGSPVVVARLRERFRQAAEAHVADFVSHLQEPVTELWAKMAVSQHVSNTVVMIESWLRTGMREEPSTVVDTFILLAPPWQLVRLSPAGVASVGRRHLMSVLVQQETGAEVAAPARPEQDPRTSR